MGAFERANGSVPHKLVRDAAALARLDGFAERYYAPLLTFFRRRARNSADVPDLVQQVFLRLSQQAELASIHNPDAFIFQTAANTLNDHFRKVEVRQRAVSDGNVPGIAADASDFSTERVLLGEEAVSLLAAALEALPERTRDVFILRQVEGLKHREVAALLGLSVRSVEKHVAKALAILSKALE